MTDALIYSDEAETVILGTLFGPWISKEHIAACLEVLEPEDFFDPQNKLIFEAIKQAFLDGEPLDAPLTIVHRLRRSGELTKAGGSTKLFELLNLAPSMGSARAHIRTLKWHRRLREWHSLKTEALASEEDAERLAAQAQDLLSDLKGASVTPPVDFTSDTADALQALEETVTHHGMKSGMPKFDSVTGGISAGQYIIVGARTSVGKTSLLVQWATAAAMQGAKCFFLSLEMTTRQVTHRILAQESGVSVQSLTSRNVSGPQWGNLSQAAGKVKKNHIWIADGGYDIDTLVAKVKRLHAQVGGLDVLAVDYIQLVKGRRSDSRTQEVGEVSRMLKSLANELNVCVLAASQLSRAHEAEKRRPTLRDLRESGSLEHDADVVVLIHRPEQDKDAPALETAIPSELIVAKNRNGRIGTTDVFFNAPTNRFEESA